MVRSLPTYAIEVAWSRATSGTFTLDSSTLDGSDVLAGFSGGVGTIYDTVTSDVKRMRITRGRQSDMSVMEQGTCTLMLADPNGTYNPENPSTPLANYLVPLRPVRIRAWHGGTEYPLFRGFVTRIEHNPARAAQETVIEGADLFEWLNVARPVITSTGVTTVGAVIGLILDELGWLDPALRDLDTGHALTDFEATGADTAMELITALLTIDLGEFFIDGGGVAVYRDTDARFRTGTPTAVASSYVSGARPGIDVHTIRNGWIVTKDGGTPQSASDATSRADYGPRDGAPITSTYLVNDAQAASLAGFLVTLHKDPQTPTTQIEIWNRDDTAIAEQLGFELGDRVTFAETHGGTSVDGAIEYLEHDISATGFHRVAFTIRERELDGFTLDSSLLDGTDVLVY